MLQALFGYLPNTFDLKLVEKGDGGLEDLVSELNPSAIMYAFVRVECGPELHEFVFIHWQVLSHHCMGNVVTENSVDWASDP